MKILRYGRLHLRRHHLLVHQLNQVKIIYSIDIEHRFSNKKIKQAPQAKSYYFHQQTNKHI